MKRIQKIISSWLICCLMLTMLPMQVFATEETATEPTVETVAETVAEPTEETMAEMVTEPTEKTVAETVTEPAEESPAAETTRVEEAVFAEAVNAAATKNETWIQQQIENGETEIYIDDAIILEHDYILSGHVRLYIRNGSITVPAGITLTNSGPQINVWAEGSIIVENGGRFVNRTEIIVDGTFAVYGTFEGVIHTYHWDRETVKIIGVPNSAIWMHCVVQEGSNDANQAKFLENWALMESTNYGYYSQQIHGDLTLPDDLVIPANCWVVLESASLTLTIPQNVKITNYGTFRAYQDQTVVNYGTFENLGNLELYGSWIGNQAVNISESWIQEQINAGKTEFALESDIILNNDFVLPQGIFLQFNGHTITVPEGRTLTVRGQLGYWWEQGGLSVESGGALINEGYIGCSGILNIQGSFSGDYIHTFADLDGMYASISGLPDEDIWVHYAVENGNPQSDHRDIFLEYLELMNSTDYGYYSFMLHGALTLPCDLVIPENCYFVLESRPFTLTIPAGSKITNYGHFVVWDNQTVANYGTFENAGYLELYGSWIGNQPVKLQMTQDQLEQILEQSEYYYLNAEVTLERDMTIDKWFGIESGARLVVPENVKLTVAENLCVMPGGTLEIQGEYELIPPENGHRSIGLYLENGIYSTITGVRAEDMSLNCMVYNTEQLMNAVELANSTNYGWDFAYVYRDVAFTEDVQADIFVQVTNGATVTVAPGVTVTNHNRMEFWEGTRLINEGRIDDSGELILFGGTTLNNKGDIQVDGVLASYGSVINSGTVNCGPEGYLDIGGTWEGNPPIIAHKHDYESVVTAPTCTEKGCTTHTCDCGDSYVDNWVDALGHTEVITEAGKAPTCSESGTSDSKHCSVCGEELAVQSVLKPTGIHDYVDGTCEYCGQERFELIDVDGSGVIDADDAVQLLWHALNLTEHTVPGWGDVTGDGKATVDDAVYVIWYTLFPEMYPV